MAISLSPTERRERVALAVNHAKSNRVLANELGVEESTIRRDRKFLHTPEDQRPVPRQKKIRRLTREQRLKQMLKVSKQWIADQALSRPDVLYHLLPAAGKLLHDARDFISTFPESPLSPAELLLATRPPSVKEDKDYKPGDMPEKQTPCTKWFAHWLACCAPRDEELQDEVLRTIMHWAEVSLPIPRG